MASMSLSCSREAETRTTPNFVYPKRFILKIFHTNLWSGEHRPVALSTGQVFSIYLMRK